MKEWQKIVLLLLMSFVLAGIFYAGIFSGFSQEEAPLAHDSFLELVLSGEVAERTAEDPLAESFGGPQPLSLQNMLQAIRKAKIDDRIKGILLRPAALSMGWGKTEELRNAFLDFRESGKPIYAYLEAAANRDYYLATAADTLTGIGTGFLFVNGFISQPGFLKDMFSKIGVEADFVAHGKYKNAPDGYTRSSMSDAQREVTNALLDRFYGRFVSTIASARNIGEPDLRRIIDEGFFTVGKACRIGLMDTTMYYAELKDFLKKKHGSRLRFVSLSRYQKVPYSSLGVEPDNSIAVIFGVGTIVIGGEKQYGRGLITSEGMARSIRDAVEDKDIKAIVLRIDSPGGSGTASDVIWREVVEARKEKPVVVSISDLAASGGYYISMAADSIVAQPNSIVGSIGVFAGKFSLAGMYDKIGMNIESIRRGRNADIFSSTSTFTPEQRSIMHGFIMDFYQDFISKVAAGRHMTEEAVDSIAQGRVWTAEQGLENGLIDKIGNFSDAVDIAKRMAKLDVEKPVKLRMYPKMQTVWEQLLSDGVSLQVRDLLPQLLDIPASTRYTLEALPYLRSGEPLFLLPYTLQ